MTNIKKTLIYMVCFQSYLSEEVAGLSSHQVTLPVQRCGQKLDLFHGSAGYNSLTMFVKSQLVCLLPVVVVMFDWDYLFVTI